MEMLSNDVTLDIFMAWWVGEILIPFTDFGKFKESARTSS